jgi:hypothetical protein
MSGSMPRARFTRHGRKSENHERKAIRNSTRHAISYKMKKLSIDVGGEQETVPANGCKERGEVPSGPA